MYVRSLHVEAGVVFASGVLKCVYTPLQSGGAAIRFCLSLGEGGVARGGRGGPAIGILGYELLLVVQPLLGVRECDGHMITVGHLLLCMCQDGWWCARTRARERAAHAPCYCALTHCQQQHTHTHALGRAICTLLALKTHCCSLGWPAARPTSRPPLHGTQPLARTLRSATFLGYGWMDIDPTERSRCGWVPELLARTVEEGHGDACLHRFIG